MVKLTERDMKIEIVEEKVITGLTIRTTNEKEMNPSTGQILKLWQRFDNTVEVDYQCGNRVYGVYYDYESDATGEFNVLAGTDQSDCNSTATLETIKIESGKYAVFQAKGAMPQIVIETWGKVWAYFSDEASELKRLYTTDFEYYVYEDEIKVYIAVE